MPSSVVCVIDTASGCARCSSPQPHASRSMSSGVSLPSAVGTVSSLMPADPLGGAALVGVDVRGRCRDHRAPARQHRLQRRDVRPRAVEHRERLDALAEVPAITSCRRAV